MTIKWLALILALVCVGCKKDTVWILTGADSTIVAVFTEEPIELDTTKLPKYAPVVNISGELFVLDRPQEEYYIGKAHVWYLPLSDAWLLADKVILKSVFDSGIMWKYKGRLPEENLEGLKLFTVREK